VLLCAGDPPADLRRALELKRIRASVARTPELALAMLVRALKEAAASGVRAPMIFVCVDPDALAESGERLVRCVQLYTPHAVCWRFDQGRSPQLSAWAPTPPTPVVRPVPPSARAPDPPVARATPEPRLRLVGEQSFRAPPPPPPSGTQIFVGPGIPLAPGTRSPAAPASPPTPPAHDPESPPPPVSDAELSMLLSGNPPNDPRGHRRT